MEKSAFLALEDGSLFHGTAIGATGIVVGEIVFNTAMTGYQEILTDPSYRNQIITFTYPHIGNTGINNTDSESDNIHIQGVIICNMSLIYSNYRGNISFSKYLKKNNIIGITNIDTRQLTRKIRNTGNQYGCILSEKNINLNDAYQYIKKEMCQLHVNLLEQVSTKNIYHWNTGTQNIGNQQKSKKKIKLSFHIVVYDFGVKKNILRLLVDYGCYLTIVPHTTCADYIISLSPDGILLSNGPGDPRIYTDIIKNIKKLLITDIPIFGICLGHQLLALANTAKIIKMKFGHHGSNHPVQNVKTKKVMITTQNHNFIIDENTLPKNIKITHISLFDNTIQGIQIKNKKIFGFQGHPEANPGPNDIQVLFKKFIKNIQHYKQN